MKPQQFEFVHPLANGSTFMGEIKISGTWYKENGELIVNVDLVRHNNIATDSANCPEWRFIPNTLWTWLNADKIEDIAYAHCLKLSTEYRGDIDHTLQLNNQLD